MSGGDPSGGIVEVEEEEVAFGLGSEILTLDLDFLGDDGWRWDKPKNWL